MNIWRKFTLPIKIFWYGVENVIAYFPVIWRDRDWDWVYIADLLEFKLTRMANHLEKYSHDANSKDDIAKIRLCAALLKRIADEDYDTPAAVKSTRQTPAFEYMIQQDEKLLFETLRKHWRCWWD